MHSASTAASAAIEQRTLACGVDLLSEKMPGYHTATLIVRVNGGTAAEPPDHLGLAYVLEQAIDKGTARHGARALADAFDALGARYAVYTGRQSWVFIVSALPELLPAATRLVGELVVEPVFPDDAVKTAISLTRQQLSSLEDSPRALLRRQMAVQAFGPVLGRHPLGTAESLERVDAAAARELWRRVCRRGAVTAAVAGAYDDGALCAALEEGLAALSALPAEALDAGARFTAAVSHVPKDLEQTQIGISFPGVAYDDPAYPVEQVLLAVLSGGMSARLFSEVREKRGLVYWVSAWHEQPRHSGMVHVGAATTPQRCRETYETLLREVARLEHDLTEEELERAKTGLIADDVTSGASVQRRVGDLLVDHFHLGHARPAAQRLAAVRRVTLADVQGYLRRYPREALSIVTVGREPIHLGD
ncbi:MAG: insulinase family protein [Proteobacteria bacterium]|nr:insulinase family protein [Pseudomonadota bacterium]